MRVLVCDDHPICREAFAIAIGAAQSGVVVDHAATLAEAEQAAQRHAAYALVLLDLMLPDSEGFAGLMVLRRLLPDTPVAITSSATDADLAHRAAAFGAAGFVPKSLGMVELVDTFKRLIAGERIMPRFAASGDGVAAASRLDRLTPAQLKVVLALSRGRLNKEVAHDLGVSEATVKAHLAAAFKKLEVGNRTQAVLLVRSLDVDAQQPI